MFTAYFCRVCGKTQSVLTGYCNHEEPHATFTWYDTDTVRVKLSKKNQSGLANGPKKIVVQKSNIIIEDYPTKRNKRIAIKRYALIATAIIIWTGLLLWMM